MFPDRHAGFCHLHQRYQTFLHSGTAGTDVKDHRKLFLRGTFKNPGDLFPYDLSHTGHHETAVTDTKSHWCPFYGTLAGDHSFIKPCLFAESTKFFFIPFVLKGISFFHMGVPLHEAFSVCDHFDPPVGRYMKIISAVWTDIMILFYLIYKNRCFAGIAFTHQVIRHLRSVFMLLTADIPDCFFEHMLNSH